MGCYKNIGELATFLPTYTNSFTGEQGYELGARYIFAKNLGMKFHILMVNDIENDKIKNTLVWSFRISFLNKYN